MKLLAFLALLLPGAVFAASSGSGLVDWQRRVLSGSGTGAPDLNAPSIAVARRNAERTARTAAVQGALDALRASAAESGAAAAAMVQEDRALLSSVEARLRASQALQEHFFIDGGVSLTVELSLDALPQALLKELKSKAQGTAVPDLLDPDRVLGADETRKLLGDLRTLSPQQPGAVLSSDLLRRSGVIRLTLRLDRPGRPSASVVLEEKNFAALRSTLAKALGGLFQ